MNPRRLEKKRRWGRLLRIVLGTAFAVYLAWLALEILSYRKYEAPPKPARTERTMVPPGGPAEASPLSAAPPEPIELRGAYHLHSRHSDGSKTPAELAAAAERAGLDFIILTDHGVPNLASLEAQGRAGRILVIAGTEISSSRGHLVALGFDPPARPFSQEAGAAAREVHAQGGFTVIAHPYSKTRWSWGSAKDADGLEIINLDGDLRRGWGTALFYAPVLLVKPTLALLKILDPPTAAAGKWDRILAETEERLDPPAAGYYSLDTHRVLHETAFGVLNLHIQLDSLIPADDAAASRAVLDSLRRGRFYNAVDAAADPAGFRFWAEGGPTAPATLHVRAPFPFAHEIRLLRQGEPVAAGTGPELVFNAREPGAYRVEVHLRARTPLPRGVPWICSNPIIVRKEVP